jgi:hypothetical protein
MVGRDENGRWKKGVSGNKGGRQKKQDAERYYEILRTQVTPERWTVIVDKAIFQAERGDANARNWITNYIIGAPETNINLKGKGGFDIHVIYENKPKPKTTNSA